MKILIITFGSRGDVQPYVALGKGLKQAGHVVTLCTAQQFEPFIRQHGLDYGYMTGELLQLMDTDVGRQAMEETVGLLGSMKTMAKLVRQTNPLNRQMILDSWAAAQRVQPDIIIYHPKALGAASFAEALGASPLMAMLQPLIVPTGDFPPPGMPVVFNSGVINRQSYRAVAMGYRMYGGMVNRLRQSEMGLEKTRRGTGLLTTSSGQAIPVMHGFSRHVVPRPADWPPQVSIPGFWFLDHQEDWQPPEELLAFLESGPPPVYIGFGSMAGRNPAHLATIVIDAVRQSGVRAIIATGWGGLQVDTLPGTIFKIDQVPHDWLFPRVSAVVHHGGAGTTAAGLRAGRPTLIVPFMGDQPFWGARVQSLGAGPAPIPQKKLAAANLSQALRTMLSSSDMRESAEHLGRLISAEDGVGSAVTVVEALYGQTTAPVSSPIPA